MVAGMPLDDLHLLAVLTLEVLTAREGESAARATAEMGVRRDNCTNGRGRHRSELPFRETNGEGRA